MEYFIDGGESCPNPGGTPKKITTALKMVSWPQFFFDFDEPGTKWRVIYSSFFLSNYFHNIIYGTVHNFHKCTCMSNLKKLNSAPLPSNAERKITGITAKEAPMMSYFNPQKYLAQIFFYTRCAKKKKKNSCSTEINVNPGTVYLSTICLKQMKEDSSSFSTVYYKATFEFWNCS